ncbi:PREDICTED: uncharacterized protein LOC109475074 isoform X1 [Branchiostoma belcheri]|uniref:Uncharacterized protein LOC109475074 isoform X1 n=2 Tax=Branchiostoma belcheri TaxID=7741 RepID=A0A6P4YNX5_BRABE|nr:PREDICTED: uncharacterized protein LOC109475074 isoform X1 [Branchiostoma belcheri]XP_019631175.1 PREDICTED: uncharacterized protein LOC109475074 isoform X1 [Branchiostoma belcheri]
MSQTKAKLSNAVEEFQELDLIFSTGSDLDVVKRGYANKLIHAICSQNYVLECEALKSLGDLYLYKAKRNRDKAENFNRAISLYTELLNYYRSIEEKHVAQHRINYAEKCTKLSVQEPMNLGTGNSVTTTLAVSMTLYEMEEKAKEKGYGLTPLIEGYTDSFIKAIVERKKRLQIESLKSIGDVYLEKGRVDKDEAALTKSADLYRAALDRCEDSDGREALRHRIKYAEKVKGKGAKAKKRLETKHVQGTKGGNDSLHTAPPSLAHETCDVMDRRKHESTYQEHMREGCRALQTGHLEMAEQSFAAALKSVHFKDSDADQQRQEAESMCKLSNVYLQKGIQSKDGGDFTKAAALSNAALVRSKNEDRDGIKQEIQKVTQSFVKHVLDIEQTVPLDDVERHKSILLECRGYVEKEIKKIEQQVDPYSLDDDDLKIREVEKMRVEAIKSLFDTIVYQRKAFISHLVDECIEVMGPPPCKYAMIGLGSHATGLVTPYSDLEFAILIENEINNIVEYFQNLTHYLHLKVINLGETILPAMAIKSLNDFKSDNKLDNWFYDSVTPRGFSFDGAMPHACKTPLGRGKTCLLIHTPREMTKVLEDDITLYLKEGYHLASVLGNVSLITGEQDLVDEYMALWDQRLKDSDKELVSLVAEDMLKENSEKFHKQGLTGRMLDVKKEIYRFSSLAVSCWALLFDIQPTTMWETIQKMRKNGAISAENAHHLMVLVSISAELRLRTYMNNGGQVENMSALSSWATISDIGELSNKVFYISNSKQLMRYYYTAIPLKRLVSQFRNRQPLPTEGPSILFDKSSKVQAEIYLSLCDYHSSKQCTKQALQTELCRHGPSAIHPDIADLLKKLGNACIYLGDYQECLEYYEQFLQMLRGIHGKSTAHRDITAALHNLGNVWNDIGDHMKGLSYHKQSLHMTQSIYGKDTAHPDAAYSLNSLGTTWRELGDHGKALSYCEHSLEMMRTIYGKSNAHPDIAHLLTNVGDAWSDLGDHKKALRYYEQSLLMRLSIYGECTVHPEIAASLISMGSAFDTLGEHRKAVNCYEQSLQIMWKIYGKSTAHPVIAQSLNSLGIALKNLGDNRKAVSCIEQSLSMRRRIYGRGTAHREIAQSLTSLGAACYGLGEYTKAVGYYEQSLLMKRSIYGKATAHPSIVASLNNLGNAWNELRDHRKAVSYHEQSLHMMRSIHGEEKAHPVFSDILNNLGCSWSYLGDHEKAFNYHEKSLHMRWSIYGQGSKHPDIATSLNNLGNDLRRLGDHRKAVYYYEQSLQMRQRVYDDSKAHPDIAQSLDNLGYAWSDLGEHRKAVTYHEQALEVNRSIYGMMHPSIAVSLSSLGNTWSDLGDHIKAVNYYENALAMRLSLNGEQTANPDIMLLFLQLGNTWRKLGDRRKARICMVRASLMWDKSLYSDYGNPITFEEL